MMDVLKTKRVFDKILILIIIIILSGHCIKIGGESLFMSNYGSVLGKIVAIRPD